MGPEEGNALLVNLLIKKEADLFVAHCLELDIVATGKSMAEVKENMIALIVAQIDYAFSHHNLENLYRPAPPEVWEEFYQAEKIGQDAIPISSTFIGEGDLPSFAPPWIIAAISQTPTGPHA